MLSPRRRIGIEVVIVTAVVMAFAYVQAAPFDVPWLLNAIPVLVWVGAELFTLEWIMRRGQRLRRPVHLTLGVAYVTAALIGAGADAARMALEPHLFGELARGRDSWQAMRGGLINGVLILGVWSLVSVVPRMVRQERERYEQQRAADRIRIAATLEPHFVLNTLNMIAGLVGREPERARELIGDLGDLLRDVVRNADRVCHAASDEIAWLARYAHLVEARHPGRLAIRIGLADDARGVAVPIMLLQPVLENAIHHGALRGRGHVEVDVRIVDGRLRCTVDDDGPGPQPGPIRDAARGIALVRQRLALDAPGGTFELTRTGGGARATLWLPAGMR